VSCASAFMIATGDVISGSQNDFHIVAQNRCCSSQLLRWGGNTGTAGSLVRARERTFVVWPGSLDLFAQSTSAKESKPSSCVFAQGLGRGVQQVLNFCGPRELSRSFIGHAEAKPVCGQQHPSNCNMPICQFLAGLRDCPVRKGKSLPSSTAALWKWVYGSSFPFIMV
jgi:hypothetical protein